jgi:alpha-beta hydrolase superfamily lysophospholipase
MVNLPAIIIFIFRAVMKAKKYFRKVVYILVALFILMNGVAYMHAYKFTHFSEEKRERTADPKALSLLTKLKVLAMGIDNPKPKHKEQPSRPFTVLTVNSTKALECWSLQVPEAKGTVILFHGYSGEKSSLLARSNEFAALGYNTFLVDFMGSGGSEGHYTTVGFKEAEQVRDCFAHVQKSGEQNIYLFGTSMGAAAILKAMDDDALTPAGIILECPFGSLYSTVCARFKLMGVPAFPMAGLLTFWGGAQHGYWAFAHNPAAYAKSVKCPTLVLFGEQDNRVSREEVDLIYKNLRGYKVLKTYAEAGHNVYSTENQKTWTADVTEFMTVKNIAQP